MKEEDEKRVIELADSDSFRRWWLTCPCCQTEFPILIRSDGKAIPEIDYKTLKEA